MAAPLLIDPLAEVRDAVFEAVADVVYSSGSGGGEPDVDTYYRPGGVDTYHRPGGADIYLRPA